MSLWNGTERVPKPTDLQKRGVPEHQHPKVAAANQQMQQRASIQSRPHMWMQSIGVAFLVAALQWYLIQSMGGCGLFSWMAKDTDLQLEKTWQIRIFTQLPGSWPSGCGSAMLRLVVRPALVVSEFSRDTGSSRGYGGQQLGSAVGISSRGLPTN